jgi:hypothetical protein
VRARAAETSCARLSSSSGSGSSCGGSSRPSRCASAGTAALEPALAVVAEAREHAAEWFCGGVEARAAGVVLEAGQRPDHTGLELALEQHVADHAPLAGDGIEGEKADSRHVLTVEAAIAAAEELVAAADRKGRCAPGDRLVQPFRLPEEILGYEQLLSILPAPDVVEVVLAGHDGVSDPERGHLQLVPAPRRSPREHRDVAAVGVDVEVVRVEVSDADRRHRERSQYGFASPREARIRCRPSMAV